MQTWYTISNLTNEQKPTLHFVGALIAIGLFIWVLVPFALDLASPSVVECIQEKDIDCSALFYTESPEAVEAGFLMMKD